MAGVYDRREMETFGFDRDNITDCMEWEKTNPNVKNIDAECGYLAALKAATVGVIWAQDWYYSVDSRGETDTLSASRHEADQVLSAFDHEQSMENGALFWAGCVTCQRCENMILVSGSGPDESEITLPEECSPKGFRSTPSEVSINIRNPQPPRVRQQG